VIVTTFPGLGVTMTSDNIAAIRQLPDKQCISDLLAGLRLYNADIMVNW